MAYFEKNYTTANDILAGATSAEQFISEVERFENAPFDVIVVSNKSSSCDIEVNLDKNTNRKLVVFAGQNMAENLQKFSDFSIKNLHAADTLSAGEVDIRVQRTTPQVWR